MRMTIVLMLVLHAGLAVADGQFEINQLCVPTGCFSGDAAGWPVTISEPGSYVLTSNLEVPVGFEGIAIEASRVQLDLGGFAVQSGFECTGALPSCAGDGASRGIGVDSLLFPENVTIENGSVAGFTDDCLRVSGAGVVLRQLQVSSCGIDGIHHQGQGIIESVVVRNALNDGVLASNAVLIRDSFLLNNGRYGVSAGICSGNVFNTNGDVVSVSEENCLINLTSSICKNGPCP